MSDRFIRIVGYGLIGANEKNEPFRQVFFKDESTEQEAELIVYKNRRPELWADVEKLEKGGRVPPLKGEVKKINEIAFVLFFGEEIEQAFARKKVQMSLKQEVTYKQAETLREKSKGYLTNLTSDGAMEIGWRKIDKTAKMVRFRDYLSNGNFVWSNWYEIVEKRR